MLYVMATVRRASLLFLYPQQRYGNITTLKNTNINISSTITTAAQAV